LLLAATGQCWDIHLLSQSIQRMIDTVQPGVDVVRVWM